MLGFKLIHVSKRDPWMSATSVFLLHDIFVSNLNESQFRYLLLPHGSVQQVCSEESINHYNAVILTAMASQITSLTIVYSTVYSGTRQRKYQSCASLAFVRRIHRWPVNSPHTGPVTRKMFPLDDVIMRDGTGAMPPVSDGFLPNSNMCPWISSRFGFYAMNKCMLRTFQVNYHGSHNAGAGMIQYDV